MARLLAACLALACLCSAGFVNAADSAKGAIVVAAPLSDAANRTSNYTVCDPVCHKHVMWFEGIIVLIVILIALLVGTCCMHLVDVPTRFAQPEQSRQHND